MAFNKLSVATFIRIKKRNEFNLNYLKKSKMKIVKKIIALLILISITISCNNNNCINGEGPITTKILELEDFQKMEIPTSSNIIISQGEIQEVKIIGHSNIINQLNTSVNNKNLYLDLESGCYSDFQLDIEITMPLLESISINGSSNVLINNFENQNSLELSIFGSGNVTLNEFEGITNLDVNISGSGSFEGNNDISTLDNSTINVSGSGDYYGYNIKSKNIIASVTGSGKAELYAIDNLEVNITGSGKAYYKGNPFITENITGSGRIINDN